MPAMPTDSPASTAPWATSPIFVSSTFADMQDERSHLRTLSSRAWMILMAAQGIGNDEIDTRLNTRREIVSQWRKRFFKDRLAGLEERARPGRPRQRESPQR